MLSFLAFALVSTTVKSQLPAPTLQPTVSVPAGEIPSVCIWGRNNAENFNTGFVGQFYYDGLTSAGKNAYKLVSHSSCSSTAYYVKRNAANTQWWISDGKDSDSSYAKCYETDIDDCTANKWQVYEKSGAYEVDSEMYSKYGDCPNWNCNTVSLNTGTTYCQKFTQQLGDNAWKDSSNYVWYFNPVWWLWICVNNAQYPYDACSVSYVLSADGWKDLTSGNSVALSPTITATCDGTGNQPTSGTQQTLKPTPQPTDKPIIPGTLTTTTTATVSIPTTLPVPTTTTVDTDSEVDCVGISNLDNGELNGNWNKEGISGGRSMYSLGNYWLYFVDEGSHKYWMIGEVQGSADRSTILAYCLKDDVIHCSGAFWIWNEEADYVEEFNSLVIDCSNEADDGGVKGAAADIVGGIVKMWWIWIIIAIIVVCCCCGCILYKRKKGKAYFSAHERREDDWY